LLAAARLNDRGVKALRLIGPSAESKLMCRALTCSAANPADTAALVGVRLKDPASLRPGTLEPKRNMDGEDSRALTAFLMSQKGSEKQEAKK
jgi:hypothetical protein